MYRYSDEAIARYQALREADMAKWRTLGRGVKATGKGVYNFAGKVYGKTEQFLKWAVPATFRGLWNITKGTAKGTVDYINSRVDEQIDARFYEDLAPQSRYNEAQYIPSRRGDNENIKDYEKRERKNIKEFRRNQRKDAKLKVKENARRYRDLRTMTEKLEQNKSLRDYLFSKGVILTPESVYNLESTLRNIIEERNRRRANPDIIDAEL